tara:strand:+ start:336 stop:1043 length:708 start_codon:yes stop_codon:yes gene_type:complete
MNKNKNADTLKKLSSEWPQIQLSDSIHGVISDKFSPDSNAILFPEKLEGDFDGLTAHFIESFQLKDTDSIQIPTYNLEHTSLDETLHPLIRKAAKNFHDAITYISENGKGADISKLCLQGKKYENDEQHWHTDGYIGKRRIGIRVSGPETEIAHIEDVTKLDINKLGHGETVDDPRITTYGLGTIWANKPGDSRTILQTILPQFFKPEEAIDAVMHRKAKPNGKPGLIYTTNLDL